MSMNENFEGDAEFMSFLGADDLPEPKEQPGWDRFMEIFDRECGADYTTGGNDPSGTYCDRNRGHYPGSDHEGPDPFGGDGRVSWRGGGSCAGDALPFSEVAWLYPREANARSV
jgi:hypothetical protein